MQHLYINFTCHYDEKINYLHTYYYKHIVYCTTWSTHSAHYYTKKTIQAINTCQDVFFTLSFQNYQNHGEFSMIRCIFYGKPSFISLQMKPDYKHRVPAGPFQITEAVQHRVLEQHASQLLLDFKMSVFADIGAIFGIICMRTSVCILHSICYNYSTSHIHLHNFILVWFKIFNTDIQLNLKRSSFI